MNDQTGQHLIAVDVGNSRTKFGLFSAAASHAIAELPACLQSVAVRHDETIDWATIRGWIDEKNGERVDGILAGVNPQQVDKLIETWPEEWTKPRVIDHSRSFPLQTALDEPRKAGIDRLLNAVAANAIRPVGQTAIIVDSGTATTIDFLSDIGVFEGGAILPGFELSALSLHHYTALLPVIPIDELAEKSHEPLGRNTREALRSGLYWSQLGAVKELIARLSSRSIEAPFIILCGGGASLLAPQLTEAHWLPHLALQGLVLVADEPQP